MAVPSLAAKGAEGADPVAVVESPTLLQDALDDVNILSPVGGEEPSVSFIPSPEYENNPHCSCIIVFGGI